MLDIYDEFLKLIKALTEESINYALCGGMALAVHGRPRATIDIDVLIPSESLEPTLTAARQLGYTVRGTDLSFADGTIEIRRVSKIDPESGDLLSLDLLLVTATILPVWESRKAAQWEGLTLWVVSKDGLITLKELRGSAQDLDDIEKLRTGAT